jgi:hypothetical protein
MDGYQIDHVAWGSTVSRSSCLVHGQVNRVQHITEKVVPHGREKSKVTVCNPLQLHVLAKALDKGGSPASLVLQPGKPEADTDQGMCIGFGLLSRHCSSESLKMWISLENRGRHVEGNATCNVAVGTALCSKDPECMGLQFSQRHGRALRSVPPDDVRPCCRTSSVPW